MLIHFGDPLLQNDHPLAGGAGHGRFTTRQAMHECQGCSLVSPVQLQSFAIFFDQVTALKTFHQKGHDRGGGDGVDAVVVAVPVGFHDEFGAPDPQVGSETGRCFVFRAVNPHLLPLMSPGNQRYPAPFVALQIAARKTAVHAAMLKEMLRVMLAADLYGARIGAALKVFHRQRLIFMLAHEGDQPDAPLAMHLQLLRVDFFDDLVQAFPGILDLVPVSGAIRVFPVWIFSQDYDGQDAFIAHD